MQNFVDGSSSIEVINGASKIKFNILSHGQILEETNPLLNDSATAVRNHFSSGRTHLPLTLNQTSSYLASSSLLHSLDGWVYLSHAIESLLKGDHGVSIHLAYYAELRASMSFLASEGIGIFNDKHLRIDAAGSIQGDPGIPIYNRRTRRTIFKPARTHFMVWEAIDKWSRSSVKPSNTDILRVFSVNGKTFEDWINSFPFATVNTGASIIKQWLRSWNFDVNYFKDDRNTRNEVSYRPQRLTNTPPKHSINQIINELSSYWNILEPYQTNKFQLLDKHLLKIFLQKLYGNLSPTIRATNSLEDVIITTLNNLGETHNQSLIDFLKDTSSSHQIFQEAQNQALDPTSNSLNALSVIARATLMLRISTGNTSLVFANAGVSKADLDILWESYGVENGFWKGGDAPNDFTELWDEIKDYVEEVSDWADSKSPDLSLCQIYEDGIIPIAYNYFKQFNRAVLWGIAI